MACPGSEVLKTFSCFAQLTLISMKCIILKNVKMPTTLQNKRNNGPVYAHPTSEHILSTKPGYK